VLTQIGNAFGQVQSALSWFVESYGALAAWKATVDRLITFENAIQSARFELQRTRGIDLVLDGAGEVRADHLDLALPDGQVIVSDTNLAIAPRDRVLISGPTGVGKSTLFRALAGIWPFGKGQILLPAQAKVLFLPQRPYLPIASLRTAVSYPAPPDTFGDEQIREALRATGLESFVSRLDDVQNWSLLLSGGEQQRLAIARAVLHKPEWLFLDEATAALDEAAESELYTLLRQRLPNAAIVSIAHRPRVGDFHETRIALEAAAAHGPVSAADHA